MQCPVCGREVADLREGMCPRCLSQRKAFLRVPDLLTITRCAHCGRIQHAKQWDPSSDADDETLARRETQAAAHLDPDLHEAQLGITIHWEDARNAMATLRLEGRYADEPVERTAQSRLRLLASACPECSRQFGGYFEAILQVRADHAEVLQKVREGALDFLGRRLETYQDEQRTGAWLSRAEDVRGGFDLYVGSLEVARLLAHELADRYGASYAESHKLMGKKDGRDVYRFTLLVRLPPYLAGDFILMDGRLYKVLDLGKKLLAAWDFERGQRIQREPKRARTLKVVGRARDEKDAVVVSYHDGTLQVLDPDTYRTVDLDVQGDFAQRETVRVFRHEDRLYVVPQGTRTGPAQP